MQPLRSVAHCAYLFLLFHLNGVKAASVTPASFAATNFDVLIVGGGTAGLVLANRLSSDGSLSVGVIDAGTYNESGDPLIDVPYGANYYINQPNATVYDNPLYDWGFNSIPQSSLGGTVIPYNRGKVLGGSSAINFMVWQRGAKAEYDTWGSVFGNGDTWSFSGLLPYFERAENWTAPATGSAGLINTTTPSDWSSLASVQGEGGPVSARYGPFYTDLDRPLTEASVTLGYPLNPNPDDGNSTYFAEFGIADSVDPNTEKRSYAAPAYYNASVRSRSNLKVLMGALATGLVWDPTTLNSSSIKATGVAFTVGGTKYVANATKEVILSAGAIQSPQLLELSGVGNSTLLKSLGIPVVLDFPQIGENFMDQPISVVDYIVKPGVLTLDEVRVNATYADEQRTLYQTSQSGAFTYASKVTGSWPLKQVIPTSQFQSMRTQLDATLANMTLTPLQGAQYGVLKNLVDQGQIGWVTPGLLPYGGRASVAQPNTSYMTMASYQLHEFSRGSIHINSSDPSAPPVIDPKFLSIPWDLQVQIVGAQFVRTMAQTQPISDLIASVGTPSANVTTETQWAPYIKSTLSSIAHPMGTTVMASQALGGIVNPRLQVYGLANVRVVDAGVIPLTVGYPIQQTVYAIAEKAAEMIAEDLGVSY